MKRLPAERRAMAPAEDRGRAIVRAGAPRLKLSPRAALAAILIATGAAIAPHEDPQDWLTAIAGGAIATVFPWVLVKFARGEWRAE
jgi:hypothetical protein